MGNFLQGTLFGLPTWLVLLIVGAGGIGLALYIRGRTQQASGNTLGQNTQSTTTDPNIDPNTGVPYAVEEAINPNTGNLNYYNPTPQTPTTPTPNPPAADPLAAWRAAHPGWETGKYQQEGHPMYGPDTRSFVTAGQGGVGTTLDSIARSLNLPPQVIEALNQSWKGTQPIAPGTLVRTGGTAPWEWNTGSTPTDPYGGLFKDANPPTAQPFSPKGGAGGAQLRRTQATPFWPIMSDIEGAR